jgi:hypothetical protein
MEYIKSRATFSEGRIFFGRYKLILEDNVKTNLQGRGRKGEIRQNFGSDHGRNTENRDCGILWISSIPLAHPVQSITHYPITRRLRA